MQHGVIGVFPNIERVPRNGACAGFGVPGNVQRRSDHALRARSSVATASCSLSEMAAD